MKKQLIRLGAAAAVLTLATACADTSDTGSKSQGISDDKVVTLGTWLPRSGALAGVGNAIDGTQMAFDEINAEGGVNGYTFEIEEFDDGGDPTRTVGAVRELWEQDKVFALFLPYGSGAANAAKDYLIQKDVPTLFPFASADIFFAEGDAPQNIFGFYPPYGSLVQQLLDYSVKENGVTTFASLTTQDEFGESGLVAARAYAEGNDVELVEEISYASGETNLAPLGRRLAASGADAILVWAIPGAIDVMNAATEAGFDGDFLVSTGQVGDAAESRLAENGDFTDKVYLSNFAYMETDDLPEMRTFWSTFEDEFPDGNKDVAVYGYSLAQIFFQAVESATDGDEELTWERLRDALESLEGASGGAATGVSYSEDNHIGSNEGRVYRWSGADWVAAMSDFEPLPGLE